jgi:hypothetical protein
MQLVDQKVRAGKIESVEMLDTGERRSADVVDLMELLKQSLRGDGTASESRPKKSSGEKVLTKRSISHTKTTSNAKSTANDSSTPKAAGAKDKSEAKTKTPKKTAKTTKATAEKKAGGSGSKAAVSKRKKAG